MNRPRDDAKQSICKRILALHNVNARPGAKIKCPVCQGEAVSESPSETAVAMMEVLAEKVDAGQSNDQIIDYFRKLQELDTEGVEPMSHPLELENVMRDDEPQPGLGRDEILANAPEKREGKFVVPRIVAD